MYHGELDLRICIIRACLVCVFASSGLTILCLINHCLSILPHMGMCGVA